MNQLLVTLQDFFVERDGRTLLSLPDFRLARGEKVALVGVSGAGKSTLLHSLYQHLRQEAALCPQQLGLVEALSVYHNIYMGRLDRHPWWVNAWNLLRPLADEWQAARHVTRNLGLEGKLDRPLETLSGGERQRVAVARALFQEKPVFLGDEPVSALDPQQGRQVLEQILSGHQTTVIALHNPELALGSFDRIIGLRDGRVVLDCPSAGLDPADLAGFYTRE